MDVPVVLLVFSIVLLVLATVGIPPLPEKGRHWPVHVGWAGVLFLVLALFVERL